MRPFSAANENTVSPISLGPTVSFFADGASPDDLTEEEVSPRSGRYFHRGDRSDASALRGPGLRSDSRVANLGTPSFEETARGMNADPSGYTNRLQHVYISFYFNLRGRDEWYQVPVRLQSVVEADTKRR